MKKGILHTALISLLAAGAIILLLLLETIIPGYRLSAHKIETNSVKKLDINYKSKLLPADTFGNDIKISSIEENIKTK